MIPWNSDNRRNVGFLIALERGAVTVIATDDDNFAIPPWDFFGHHAIVGQTAEMQTIGSTNGWFNPCSLLRFEPPIRVYSRGYPFSKRQQDEPTLSRGSGRVVVNMGLWLGDPDVEFVDFVPFGLIIDGGDDRQQPGGQQDRSSTAGRLGSLLAVKKVDGVRFASGLIQKHSHQRGETARPLGKQAVGDFDGLERIDNFHRQPGGLANPLGQPIMLLRGAEQHDGLDRPRGELVLQGDR